MNLSSEEKTFLLKTAREQIGGLFTGNAKLNVDYNKFPGLKEKYGAFVTLNINGDLRGCIGYIISNQTIYETVCDAALQAAMHDPRFSPLSKKEYELISIEISVLYPPEPLNSYEDIVIGKHGLIVDEFGRRGLLLPQVATEQGFTREEFLTAICQKAGLESYLWKKKKINLSVFTAEVFSEKEKGEINDN
jgi:AmmeMemoRadiSam system protein A